MLNLNFQHPSWHLFCLLVEVLCLMCQCKAQTNQIYLHPVFVSWKRHMAWTVQLWKQDTKSTCAVHVSLCAAERGLLVNMSVTCTGCYSDLKDNTSLREYVTHFPTRPLSSLCVIMTVMCLVNPPLDIFNFMRLNLNISTNNFFHFIHEFKKKRSGTRPDSNFIDYHKTQRNFKKQPGHLPWTE